MSITKPFPKIYRHGSQNINAPFREDLDSESGQNNIFAYELLKKDLKNVFEYIEPTSENLNVFSHRTFELLLRACTEVESLCKQIFYANNNFADNIIRFSDLEQAMKLSEYEVKSYAFRYSTFPPYKSFSISTPRNERSPNWYKSYNKVKHDRNKNFSEASLKNVIEAVGGVYVLLIAMYGIGFDHILKLSFHNASMRDVPTFFRASKFPTWNKEHLYDYNWEVLKNNEFPYQNHPLEIID